MNTLDMFQRFVGGWKGTNRLWLGPDEPARQSDSTLTIAYAVQTNVMTVHYGWSFEGEPQEGLLALCPHKSDGTIEAVWVDSWHQKDQFMFCKGDIDDRGAVSVQGSYSAPPGPDWGWRIVLEAGDSGTLTITMYNISPENQEDLAVEAFYAERS
jgi:hypothetical protein